MRKPRIISGDDSEIHGELHIWRSRIRSNTFMLGSKNVGSGLIVITSSHFGIDRTKACSRTGKQVQ